MGRSTAHGRGPSQGSKQQLCSPGDLVLCRPRRDRCVRSVLLLLVLTSKGLQPTRDSLQASSFLVTSNGIHPILAIATTLVRHARHVTCHERWWGGVHSEACVCIMPWVCLMFYVL